MGTRTCLPNRQVTQIKRIIADLLVYFIINGVRLKIINSIKTLDIITFLRNFLFIGVDCITTHILFLAEQSQRDNILAESILKKESMFRRDEMLLYWTTMYYNISSEFLFRLSLNQLLLKI